ncbi:MAG: hypothetical protein KGI00_02210 [Candidatus Micrarchaeota archaeon]|nr:hypothetical protein [Candidatus Micrarchaeota archaeon]MDE1849522.1 hypothetical protein [Candidatus Micrarchaeota archaeon]
MQNEIRIRNNVVVRPCSDKELTAMKRGVSGLYIRVFSDEPWYERYLVKMNGSWRRMGKPDELLLMDRMLAEGKLSKRDIKPFYTREVIAEAITRASQSGGFASTIAVDTQEGRVIGVSWGMSAMQIPVDEKAANAEQIICSNGLPPEKTFYFDETFVDMKYRGIGVGKGLIGMRGSIIAASGFEYAIVRTINSVQVSNLLGVFGDANVTAVYSNPNDMQPDRKYYLIDLMKAKRAKENFIEDSANKI